VNAARICIAGRGRAPLVAVLLLSGCGGSDLVLPHANDPAAIRVVQGDGESGRTGDLVSVVVEVTDDAGQPIAGAGVGFSLTSSGDGADISPDTSTTGGDGRAQAQMLLGARVGLQTGSARVVMDNPTAPRASFSVAVLPATPGNRPPRSDFDAHCQELSCEFTDKSSDDDGDVVAWSWSFGDGGTSDAREPAHVYGGTGNYTVTLTVTDNDGASDVSQNNVIVSGPEPIPNAAPKAEFEVNCSEMTCSFEDKSSDSDGTVVSWSWDFGDGSGSSDQNPEHEYRDRKRYRVTLTVTDDDGATGTKSHDARPKGD
jgi:PKD repeat protein